MHMAVYAHGSMHMAVGTCNNDLPIIMRVRFAPVNSDFFTITPLQPVSHRIETLCFPRYPSNIGRFLPFSTHRLPMTGTRTHISIRPQKVLLNIDGSDCGRIRHHYQLHDFQPLQSWDCGSLQVDPGGSSKQSVPVYNISRISK